MFSPVFLPISNHNHHLYVFVQPKYKKILHKIVIRNVIFYKDCNKIIYRKKYFRIEKSSSHAVIHKCVI